MMGVQLCALLLAAGERCGWPRAACGWGQARVPRWPPGLTPAVMLVAAIAVLASAWLAARQLRPPRRCRRSRPSATRTAPKARDVDRLIAVIERGGGGRTYAGMPSNWGQGFTVGGVPVFKYLESRDVDEVGYTLRTASLMTEPEYFFDGQDPSDYRLCGIRYLILPAGKKPPVPARLTLRSGPYWLWTINGGGYIQARPGRGTLPANRTNVGTRSVPLLHSGLAADSACLGIQYGC